MKISLWNAGSCKHQIYPKKKKKNPTGQSDNLVSPTGLTKDYDKSMKKNKLEINM